MFASAVLAAFCRSYALHFTTRIFLRVRNGLILAIYRKSLRIPSRNRDDGKINNLMSSDTQKVVEFSQQVHNLWRSDQHREEKAFASPMPPITPRTLS